MPPILPFERLFAQLQAAGFPMDTRRKLRLWRLLSENGGAYIGRLDEMKYLLAPFIATNAGEQERFYQLWTAWLVDTKPEPIVTPVVPPDIKPWWRQWLRWMPVGLLVSFITLSLVISWIIYRQLPRHYPPTSFQIPFFSLDRPVREGDTLRFVNLCSEGFDSLRWEISDATTKTVEKTDTNFHLNWVAKGRGTTKIITLRARVQNEPTFFQVAIHCATPPLIDTIIWPPTTLTQHTRYRFEAKAERGATIRWVFDGRDTFPGPIRDSVFNENGQFRVECLVARPGQEADCYEKVEKTFTVGSDKPFLQLAELQYDQPRLLRQLALWCWGLLLPLLLAATWFYRRWLRKRREKPAEKTPDELADKYPVHDRGPYFIPYRPQDGRIVTPAAFFRMAEVLCRREEDERRSFDAAASVQATVAGGGFPAWRERAQTSPPDYLFLISRSTEQDQLGRLFERLTSFLSSQDAPLTVFFHDGSFRHFWNTDQAQGVSLDWLGRQYPDHQLVLLGDGHELVNPYDTRRPALRKALTERLLRWPKRLLLTPAPVAGWSYQEALLHRHFLLYPADTEGLLAGIEALDALEEHEPDPFPFWEATQNRGRSDQTDRYHRWDTLAEHRDYLANDPDAFRWLCGLAVSSQPDYALSLAIGQALGIALTHDRLLRLARIPWLRSNEPDHGLRLELLAQLSAGEEAAARRAAETELEAVRTEVAGSFAETDWRVHLALHRFALDPRDEAHKQLIRELRALGLLSGAQEDEMEWVLQHRVDSTGLPAGATKSLDAWLELPVPKPFWTKELWSALACGMLTLALALGGWWYNRTQTEQPREETTTLAFWQVEREVADEALRLHNLAVGIAERLMKILPTATASTAKNDIELKEWKIREDSVQEVYTLFNRATALRKHYPLADSNRLSFNYNEAAQLLNSFLSDSIVNMYGVVDAIIKFQEINAKPVQINLAALHGKGLSFYYLSKNNKPVLNDRAAARKANILVESLLTDIDIEHAIDSALATYYTLLGISDSTYFDSIYTTMPVNLETLLVADGLIEPPSTQSATTNNWAAIYNNLPLRTLLLTDSTNRPSLRDPDRFKIQQLKGVVIHWASLANNGNNAMGVRNFFNTAARNSSVHYLVDDKEAINIIPPAEIAYHVGANNYKKDGQKLMSTAGLNPNYTTLSLTYCANTGASRNKTYQNTVVLTAHLLKQNKLTLNDLYRHSDLVQKDCPQDFLDDGVWARFKTDVQQAMTSLNRLRRFEGDSADPIRPSIPLPDMIFVQGGTLTLGCTDEQGKDCKDDEKPPHPVTLSDYYLGRTEVTNAQYAAFLNDYGSIKVKSGEYAGQEMIREDAWSIQFPKAKGDGRYRPQPGYEQHPVVYVSWYGAQEYCRWLSAKTGQNYRLPTEAEWEYAARGGQKADPKRPFKYAGSDNLEEVAWYTTDNSNRQTHPVGGKKANALGLYDMSGNVYEWCADWYGDKYYEQLAKGGRNPAGPDSGTSRVLRGGSWFSDSTYSRVADRYFVVPRYRDFVIGFRLARH